LLGASDNVVSDSKSPLIGTHVFVPEKGFVASHSGLDLELDTVGNWLSRVLSSLLIDCPSLVETVMAVPPSKVVVVVVATTINIQTLSSVVSNVLS
jgi:hypothetical protein